jgi:hypothetical protein
MSVVTRSRNLVLFPNVRRLLLESLLTMTTPEQLNQARVPNWFADRGPNPAALGVNDAVFSLLLPKLKLILDTATLKLRTATTNNRVPLGNVIAIVGDLIRDAYGNFVIQYEKQREPLDPAASKAAIMLMIDDFYTKVVAPLDIPYVPNFIENTFVDPAVGKIFHEVASAVYDVVVKALDAIPVRMLAENDFNAGAPAAFRDPDNVRNAERSGRQLAPNPMEQAEPGSDTENDMSVNGPTPEQVAELDKENSANESV